MVLHYTWTEIAALVQKKELKEVNTMTASFSFSLLSGILWKIDDTKRAALKSVSNAVRIFNHILVSILRDINLWNQSMRSHLKEFLTRGIVVFVGFYLRNYAFSVQEDHFND